MAKKIPTYLIPSKEELISLYITQNLTKGELCEKYNVGATTLTRWLSKNNIRKPKSLSLLAQKRVFLNKYGVTNPSQNADFRKKAEQTMIERYGVSNPSYSKELRKKAEQTMVERYGVSNASLSEELKKKKVDTCAKHFGVDYPMQSKEVKDKSKSTCLEKYGVSHISKCPEVIKKVQDTCLKKYGVSLFAKTDLYKKQRRESCLKKYGTEFTSQSRISKESFEILNDKDKLKSIIESQMSKTYLQISKVLDIAEATAAKYIRLHNLDNLMDSTVSSQEQEIKTLFSSIRLERNRTVLEGKEIDLYSEDHKIGIEFNGNYWHCDIFRDKDYHKEKSLLAEKKGILLFHIFEYEWLNPITKVAIINRLKNLFNNNKIKVYARKCQIKEVDSKEAREFLNSNHTQGYAPSQIRLGLYNNNELVALMEFIANGINKNYQYELSRFCSKAGYNVIGGASKLFKYFIKTYNPKSIISYSDIAKTTGNIYKVLGFKLDHITNPQYHWVKSSITYTRYQCQLKELRKRGWLLPNEDKSENEVMRGQGFSKIYDCGKKVWVWK